MKKSLLMIFFFVSYLFAQFGIQDIAQPSWSIQVDDSMLAADGIDTLKKNGVRVEANAIKLSVKSDTGLFAQINLLNNPAGQWTKVKLEPGYWVGVGFFGIWYWATGTGMAHPDSMEFSLKVSK